MKNEFYYPEEEKLLKDIARDVLNDSYDYVEAVNIIQDFLDCDSDYAESVLGNYIHLEKENDLDEECLSGDFQRLAPGKKSKLIILGNTKKKPTAK